MEHLPVPVVWAADAAVPVSPCGHLRPFAETDSAYPALAEMLKRRFHQNCCFGVSLISTSLLHCSSCGSTNAWWIALATLVMTVMVEDASYSAAKIAALRAA